MDFHINSFVLSPDDTTLFTTSGMQHFKHRYSDLSYFDTFSNIQQCLRVNDLEEIGDGTHFLTFEMIGLFSFRQWSLQQSIDFMYSFMNKLGIIPDYVTIHPDKYEEWRYLYDKYLVDIKLDDECIWSDGSIGGYCTEFYKNDIEIGNIVNTLGDCIDIGFGLERLLEVTNSLVSKTRLQILEETSVVLLNQHVQVGNNKQGYILKKLITESIFSGSLLQLNEFKKIRSNHEKAYSTYLRKKSHHRFKDKDDLFWADTFGFQVHRLQSYQQWFNKKDS